MDYRRFFEDAIDQLHAEKRYRVFANLERIVGKFPRAIWRTAEATREITVWCSNDYLGMGQHPDVIAAMHDASSRMGSGAGGTRNISGNNHQGVVRHIIPEEEIFHVLKSSIFNVRHFFADSSPFVRMHLVG